MSNEKNKINGIYQGYVWYSDKPAPKVYNNEQVDLTLTDGENPFVIEAQLYDENAKQPISIKFVDGKYLINEYTVNDKDIMVDEEYIPNRMPGVEKLCFKRVWRPQADEQCNGMSVLQPAELIFVGLE